MTNIGIFIFDGAEELDFVGPWEVLAMWASGWPDDDVTVFTMASTDGVVECAKGLKVMADRRWDEVDDLDVLIYPGGRGTRPHLNSDDHLNWVRSIAESGALVTSVCTGSLVLAAAGLLDGRAATTHWGSLDMLEDLGTAIDIRPDDRYVDTGDVITASGVSAGIDMALHLVARLHSPARAREVRRAIQYDPQPPV